MKLPKGDLDVTGEYFMWTANAGTNRVDAFIVRIPQSALGVSPGAPTPPPGPTPIPTPPAAPTPDPGDPAPVPTPQLPTGPIVSGDAVRWTNLVNAAVSGNTLQKVGGCGGCDDAGAVSEQRISGGGGVQFTVTDPTALRFIGLSAGGINASALVFALRLQAGVAEVREAGAYKADVRFAAGDVLGITVSGATVTYSKNGAVFYTSGSAAASSMVIAASLYDMNATINNATLTGIGTAGVSPAPAPAPAPTSPAAAGSQTGGTPQRWPSSISR
jgi:hypothetical protein